MLRVHGVASKNASRAGLEESLRFRLRNSYPRTSNDSKHQMTALFLYLRYNKTMRKMTSTVLMVLRNKLVDELLEKVHDLENRLAVAESLSIRQAQREIATGVLAEGVHIGDETLTIDLVTQQDVCLLTELLQGEIRLGQDTGSTAATPLTIADKWRACRWIGWRLTDDLVLIEIVHADFSIRFTTVLEPVTDRLIQIAGLQGSSPKILFPHFLATEEHSITIRLTTLQIHTVPNWLVTLP